MRGCVAVLVLLVSAAAVAAPASPVAVRALLTRPDGDAAPAEQWRALGEGVEELLAQAARDSEQLGGVRARAVAALGALGGPVARDTLERLLRERNPPGVQAGAAYAYARAFGATEPARVVAVCAGLLARSDWLVRRGAARALTLLSSPAARELLARHRAREAHAAVLSVIDEAALDDPAARMPAPGPAPVVPSRR